MMAAGMLAATSCTDFTDYNEAPETAQANGTKTLWENISQNPQLSDFANLVKRTGFDATLSQLNAYTVWAPVNGKFNVADYQSLSDSMLLAQFVKNHVAKFSWVATGEVNERVRLLNGKSYSFAGNGTYLYDEVPLVAGQGNQPSVNGTLHLIDGAVPFYPNLYEYLSLSSGVDSIAKYFKSYETTTLDLSESEKGPMVNGMQTYVDSVMKTSNSLTRALNAKIDNEDSSYTFLMPTDKAYLDMYNKVKNCFKFISNTKMQDITLLDKQYATSDKGDKDRNATKFVKDFSKAYPNFSPAYQSDSLARRAIVRNLVFSNNDSMNVWMKNGMPQATDSVRSTLFNKFSNPKELMEDNIVGSPVRMSNGYARIVDSLAYLPWETWCPEIIATPMRNLGKQFGARTRNVTVHDTIAKRLLGPEATEFRYMLIEPKDDSNRPYVFMQLPGVQSTTYNFYCVVLPSSVGAESANPKPTAMNFDLSYCKANGSLDNWRFSAKAIAPGAKTSDQNPKTLNMSTAFQNDPTKVDTLFLGQFTFPISYRGLEDGNNNNYYPSLFISTPADPYEDDDIAKYSFEFRIYQIILKPVDQDEYEANNK